MEAFQLEIKFPTATKSLQLQRNLSNCNEIFPSVFSLKQSKCPISNGFATTIKSFQQIKYFQLVDNHSNRAMSLHRWILKMVGDNFEVLVTDSQSSPT